MSLSVNAQRPGAAPRAKLQRDSIFSDSMLAQSMFSDSLGFGQDSMMLDLSDVNVSKDGIDDNLDYESQDSMVYDIKDQKIHLYGQAVVKYQTLTLNADYIIFDYG
ncbi:MAG: hypothetical protein AAFO94_03555, partial [Bacteroidota bacterium]